MENDVDADHGKCEMSCELSRKGTPELDIACNHRLAIYEYPQSRPGGHKQRKVEF